MNNNKLKLPKNELHALKIFKSRLRTSLKTDQPELTLFGSYARGDFRKDSDLDLLVVLKKVILNKKNLISDLATDLFLQFNTDLSPHIYSKKEFQKLSQLETPFTLMVKKEGIRL